MKALPFFVCESSTNSRSSLTMSKGRARQAIERRALGAEVVEGKLDTERVETLEASARGVDARDRDRVGDLHDQSLGARACDSERSVDAFDESVSVELCPGDVDRHVEARPDQHIALPLGEPVARGGEDPRIERSAEPRIEQTRTVVGPERERFETHDGFVDEVHDRLVVHGQFVVAKRCCQISDRHGGGGSLGRALLHIDQCPLGMRRTPDTPGLSRG